ncbi:MAG: DNA methyltransferase [Candidatus Saccharibacteria bacterium]|nr:DNA methyltransferase [Candidatus Saccharibacteria bacterium]
MYLAVLGRQPEISIAELEALGWVRRSDLGLVGRDNGRRAGSVSANIGNNGRSDSVSARDNSGRPEKHYALQSGRKSSYKRGFAMPSEEAGKIFVGNLPDKKEVPEISRLGGVLKLAVLIEETPIELLRKLPEGKITIGVSDYSRGASQKTARAEALKLKKILTRHGRSVRVLENKSAVLSTATSLHNGLAGKNERKIELIKLNEEWYKVIGVQDIDAYAGRDQARPSRDAKVGMLPPKLAQILINLCGELPEGARILDPFCGTGVVLQEALLMGYRAYGTDINERMVEYSKKNLEWLLSRKECQALLHNSYERVADTSGFGTVSLATRRRRTKLRPRACPEDRGTDRTRTNYATKLECQVSECQDSSRDEKRSFRGEKERSLVQVGDARSFKWEQPINAVVCEGYLGQPMSKVPPEIKLKSEKQQCKDIILGFLRNLSGQIGGGVPVVIAMPAWLREDGRYSRIEIIDEIEKLGYNVINRSRGGLLYHREGQIVARDIISLRKK